MVAVVFLEVGRQQSFALQSFRPALLRAGPHPPQIVLFVRFSSSLPCWPQPFQQGDSPMLTASPPRIQLCRSPPCQDLFGRTQKGAQGGAGHGTQQGMVEEYQTQRRLPEQGRTGDIHAASLPPPSPDARQQLAGTLGVFNVGEHPPVRLIVGFACVSIEGQRIARALHFHATPGPPKAVQGKRALFRDFGLAVGGQQNEQLRRDVLAHGDRRRKMCYHGSRNPRAFHVRISPPRLCVRAGPPQLAGMVQGGSYPSPTSPPCPGTLPYCRSGSVRRQSCPLRVGCPVSEKWVHRQIVASLGASSRRKEFFRADLRDIRGWVEQAPRQGLIRARSLDALRAEAEPWNDLVEDWGSTPEGLEDRWGWAEESWASRDPEERRRGWAEMEALSSSGWGEGSWRLAEWMMRQSPSQAMAQRAVWVLDAAREQGIDAAGPRAAWLRSFFSAQDLAAWWKTMDDMAARYADRPLSEWPSRDRETWEVEIRTQQQDPLRRRALVSPSPGPSTPSRPGP
jgi:hypothetical protein